MAREGVAPSQIWPAVRGKWRPICAPSSAGSSLEATSATLMPRLRAMASAGGSHCRRRPETTMGFMGRTCRTGRDDSARGAGKTPSDQCSVRNSILLSGGGCSRRHRDQGDAHVYGQKESCRRSHARPSLPDSVRAWPLRQLGALGRRFPQPQAELRRPQDPETSQPILLRTVTFFIPQKLWILRCCGTGLCRPRAAFCAAGGGPVALEPQSEPPARRRPRRLRLASPTHG